MDQDIVERAPDWSKDSAPSLASWLARACRAGAEGDSVPEPVEAVWRDRQRSVIDFVLAMMCALRDAGYVKLDLALAFKALELENVERLADMDWLGDEPRAAARRHLDSLPGYDPTRRVHEQGEGAREAHDFLRFGIELPARKALGLGFGDARQIPWERIPGTRFEMCAIEEAKELAAFLERGPKKRRRRL